MAIYECSVCGYIYDESKEEVPWLDLPETWVCPLCDTEKRFFKIKKSEEESVPEVPKENVDTGSYLGEWRRPSDELEIYMEHIHKES